MPWFKIDDKHHDHKKTRRALRGVPGKRRDAAAMGLWELAGSWSADNLMDGFVPTDELHRWDDDGESLAARLVDAEYWERVVRDGEEGFQFINWHEHQPTKADVEAKREAARERMRSVRAKGGKGSGEVRANEHANSERSSGEVRSTPSRPDPSRPVPSRPTNNPSSDKSDHPLDRFDEFWDTYGNKQGRKKSETAYRVALKKPGVTADLLITAAAQYVAWCNKSGTFLKNPLTWLHGEHWNDERVARPEPKTNVQQHLDLARRLAAQDDGATIHQIGSGR